MFFILTGFFYHSQTSLTLNSETQTLSSLSLSLPLAH
ncbi:hypothetical protein Ahy_B05g075324 isoform B [Arachis hypogaea]|uniref:Uncharacterized protein n=1 Tax=Arachis hypogaea TaxID=3818 RepID=A0A444Z0Y8_ARAHY|nr:hypothetical protein Ahy_B05g075324 isoform B [Arachis hypogaea]